MEEETKISESETQNLWTYADINNSQKKNGNPLFLGKWGQHVRGGGVGGRHIRLTKGF